MSKLYFRFGAVGSAKTLNLLAVAHNYRQQGKEVILLKPSIDNRFGKHLIKTRAGLDKSADYLVDDDSRIFDTNSPLIPLVVIRRCSCILVDEAQFLSNEFIEDLMLVTIELRVPVICYGLKTNFKGELFSGSKRLLELADALEEVKTTCNFCNRKATFNLRMIDGSPTLLGDEIKLGTEETYVPTCKVCYLKKLNETEFAFSALKSKKTSHPSIDPKNLQ